MLINKKPGQHFTICVADKDAFSIDIKQPEEHLYSNGIVATLYITIEDGCIPNSTVPEETAQTNSLVEQLISSGPIKPRVDPQPVGSMPGASKLEIGLDYADIPKVTQSLVERLKENIDE